MQLQFIKYLGDLGVKRDYQPWEVFLTRKINLSSTLGFFNVAAALLVFIAIGYYDSIFECVVVLILSPLVFILNLRFGYIAAGYLFTLIGCFLFYFLSVKMGAESYALLYYMPLTLGVIQIMGRKEIMVHLISMFGLCLLSVAAVIISYKFDLFQPVIQADIVVIIKYINIFFSFFVAIIFMLIISSESIKQENQLKLAIQQKEVLLAELFHRVKNNLNIITSLLNLKKESVNSEEAKTALEECRNLIFSMSLVHNKIYNSNNIDNLNFKDYLEDLSRELVNSIGGKSYVECELKADDINLNISYAIPFGLIINELMINSFKHARVPGNKLNIKITLAYRGEELELVYSDNGPGIKANSGEKEKLGIGLIKSLAEQLNGKYSFSNNNGMEFRLSFPV